MMNLPRLALALTLAAGLAAAVPTERAAAADGCPGKSHPAYEAGNVVHCRCDEGYKNIGGSCQPIPQTAPALQADPAAARLSRAQLQLVDGRIAALQKAVALLGNDNPEWARERDRVLEDMHDDAVGFSLEAVNLMSLGLAEFAKRAAQSGLASARIDALFQAIREPMAHLPAEEARLNQIMATTDDPALAQAIVNYTAALHRLRDAHDAADTARMFARLRDAVDALKSEFEMMERNPPSSKSTADGLYVSSAMLGRVAIVFVAAAEGPEAVAAAAGSIGASVLVGGREAVNLWQERGRLAALDQNASDRNRMKIELNRRLDDLRQQRERLLWAAEHAGSGGAQ